MLHRRNVAAVTQVTRIALKSPVAAVHVLTRTDDGWQQGPTEHQSFTQLLDTVVRAGVVHCVNV